MGYYYCKPKPYDAHTSNVVLFLLVALTLLGLPYLFSREAEEVVEDTTMNLSALIALILVLIILILVSFMGSPKKVYGAPPCYRCKHVCYCYWYPKNC